MTFEERVRAMSAKQIILTMVEGLENPSVNVDMASYGSVTETGICFGCAATNTVCRISGVTFDKSNIALRGARAAAVGADYMFLANFETAINLLRLGDITGYNTYASANGFATIREFGVLPRLEGVTYKGKLYFYRELAEKQGA